MERKNVKQILFNIKVIKHMISMCLFPQTFISPQRVKKPLPQPSRVVVHLCEW